ncbi:MAG: hypothetical protein ACOC22_03385 [bacterium]
MEELTFSTFDKKPLYLENHFNGSSCFLVLCGPSLNNYDLSKLEQPGIMTLGVNNSPAVFRPKMWTCVDHPARFMISVWKDPSILKLVPFHKHKNEVFDNYNWKETNIKVKELSNVVYYHRNEKFNPETYFTEKTINWGNHKDYGGGRSVMMAALKMLYVLGFKNVFLLGCDFKMTYDSKNYAWDQGRTKGSVNCNNNTYSKMIERYKQLQPYMEKYDFHVYNCNPFSNLEVFPFIEYDDAINMCLKDFPDVKNEKSAGMYERFNEKKDEEKRRKEKEKRLKKIKEIKQNQVKIKEQERGLVYYNVDRGAIVRMAVSLSTCIKHYNNKNIVILSDEKGYDDCKKIADYFDVKIKLIETEKLDRKEVLLNKCLMHKYTPFKNTIMIDSDTIVLDKFDELHDLADINEFVVPQFSNWTTEKRTIKKRILQWQDIFPDMIEDALKPSPSVNTGVYAFKKDSELMNVWFDVAKHGTHMFIPDEQSCHLLLPKYKNAIVPSKYNCSCKYDIVKEDTKIIHYHGKKHCRIDKENGNFLFNSDKWYKEFEKIKDLDFIKDNIQFDSQLRKNIGRYNEKI